MRGNRSRGARSKLPGLTGPREARRWLGLGRSNARGRRRRRTPGWGLRCGCGFHDRHEGGLRQWAARLGRRRGRPSQLVRARRRRERRRLGHGVNARKKEKSARTWPPDTEKPRTPRRSAATQRARGPRRVAGSTQWRGACQSRYGRNREPRASNHPLCLTLLRSPSTPARTRLPRASSSSGRR